MSTLASIDEFIDRLIAEKSPGTDIPPEVLTSMRDDLRTRLDQMIFLKLVEQLSPEQFDEFEALESSDTTNEELKSFLDTAIPDQTPSIIEALSEFRELYLGPPAPTND